MGKTSLVACSFPKRMELSGLIAPPPRSLDSMSCKTDTSKTVQKSALFRMGLIPISPMGALPDETNVSATLLQMQQVGLLHFPSLWQKASQLLSYTGVLRKTPAEDTCNQSHTSVSVPYFSLTARCGTSAVLEGTLITVQGLCSPLQTPKWVHTAPRGQIYWGFIKPPSSSIWPSVCHVSLAGGDAVTAVWQCSSDPGKGTPSSAVWQLCFSQHLSSASQNSTTEQQTLSEATQPTEISVDLTL